MENGQAGLPGGVQASSGDWTKAERLFVGMGRAIFSSLCLASAACTASVWMSARAARRRTVSHTAWRRRDIYRVWKGGTRIEIALVHDFISCFDVATVVYALVLQGKKTKLHCKKCVKKKKTFGKSGGSCCLSHLREDKKLKSLSSDTLNVLRCKMSFTENIQS